MPRKAKTTTKRQVKIDELGPYMEMAQRQMPHVPSVLDSLGISDDLLDKLVAQQQELNDTKGLKSTKKDGSYRTDATKTLAKIGLDLNKDGKIVKDEIVTIRVGDDLEALLYAMFMAGVLLHNIPVKYDRNGNINLTDEVYQLIYKAVDEKYPDNFTLKENDHLIHDLINNTLMPKTKTFSNKRLNMKKKIAKQLAEVSKGFTFIKSDDNPTMFDDDNADQMHEQQLMSMYDTHA